MTVVDYCDQNDEVEHIVANFTILTPVTGVCLNEIIVFTRLFLTAFVDEYSDNYIQQKCRHQVDFFHLFQGETIKYSCEKNYIFHSA